ncbi:ABC transporter ATP-binding protein [Aeromicrobium piscarium]|uniref:ABC transporter ATP-binding protein n=1 Tax=Aeromicrobium piscarium TaxID=2590901 RepID=A0A554SB79_9ACTN|nr:ABC transporter ATP-binding protein [Aeromicrobium piscarium]TSD63596.1 ABC transporter ATP-binding protein [Aeromicrobium piscarium]
MTSPPLFSLESVSVRFAVGRRRHVTAVDRVSLDLFEGETLGLIGESGSGKSTVARAAIGLAPVSAGTVRWRGQDVASFAGKERRRFTESVQMVFQDPHSALDPRRTILQSVREPLDVMRRGEKREREQIAVKALEDVGLSAQFLTRYPHQLSGGQKQRVNIARALVTDPKVLICDESVAALDVALQAEILNLLQDLKAEYELTVLFISHDLSVVSHLADRICVMYLGRIVEQATTPSLVDRSLHPYSEALLSAQPLVHQSSAHRRIVLSGDIPSPLSPPPGCRFSTRCPHVIDSCRSTVPELAEVGHGHDSACLRTAELYGRERPVDREAS